MREGATELALLVLELLVGCLVQVLLQQRLAVLGSLELSPKGGSIGHVGEDAEGSSLKERENWKGQTRNCAVSGACELRA